jgi:hypothetical protein
MNIKLEEERDDEFLILPLANFSFAKAVLSFLRADERNFTMH